MVALSSGGLSFRHWGCHRRLLVFAGSGACYKIGSAQAWRGEVISEGYSLLLRASVGRVCGRLRLGDIGRASGKADVYRVGLKEIAYNAYIQKKWAMGSL